MNTVLNSCTGQLHNIFKFHFWTGLRPSELIELKYSDIDNGKVFISRKRTADSKKAEKLKTPSSYRSIKLLPDALAPPTIFEAVFLSANADSALVILALRS